MSKLVILLAVVYTVCGAEVEVKTPEVSDVKAEAFPVVPHKPIVSAYANYPHQGAFVDPYYGTHALPYQAGFAGYYPHYPEHTAYPYTHGAYHSSLEKSAYPFHGAYNTPYQYSGISAPYQRSAIGFAATPYQKPAVGYPQPFVTPYSGAYQKSALGVAPYDPYQGHFGYPSAHFPASAFHDYSRSAEYKRSFDGPVKH